MDDIRQLKIAGIDPARPPRLRKEPYIDLYFRLSFKAPPRWCEMFNDLAKTGLFPAKIKPDTGDMIETWVREVDEVAASLQQQKDTVKRTTEAYLERVRLDAEQATRAGDRPEDQGEQGRLNRVIDGLDFSD